MLSYLGVLLFIVVGSGWLELFLRTRVLARWKRLLVTLVPVSLLFVAWDLWAVAAGHWWFDSGQILGVILPGGLPVEELLFFPVVGFAAILTIEAVRSVRRARSPAPGGDA